MVSVLHFRPHHLPKIPRMLYEEALSTILIGVFNHRSQPLFFSALFASPGDGVPVGFLTASEAGTRTTVAFSDVFCVRPRKRSIGNSM